MTLCFCSEVHKPVLLGKQSGYLQTKFQRGKCTEFNRLTPAFYIHYSQCEEILTKESRPYYVAILELDGFCFAIPLRSHISHPYCFIADAANNQKSGLDYSKAVVIIDKILFIDPSPVTIRQNEFDVMKQHEFLIKRQFSAYVRSYKKEMARRLKNPVLPVSNLARYSSLKYFHKELGLS
jgi:protein AbiQ